MLPAIPFRLGLCLAAVIVAAAALTAPPELERPFSAQSFPTVAEPEQLAIRAFLSPRGRLPTQDEAASLAPVLALTGASALHAQGITGKGVKVGIIDEDFFAYERLLGRGLPEGVVTKSFHPDGLKGELETGHGTAVAELVHAMAPDAQLYLVNAEQLFDPDAFSEAVEYLVSQQVDIIVIAFGRGNAGPGDGTGSINEIIDRTTAAGILWVVAAGNAADAHWGGRWNDPDGNNVLNFAGRDETNDVRFLPRLPVIIDLRWDEPWSGACTDLQIRVYSAIGNTLEAKSQQQQDCSPDSHPADTVLFRPQARSRYSISIVRVSGTGAPRLDLFLWDILGLGPLAIEYTTPQGSLLVPADNERVLSVGAVPLNQPTILEPFSSRGPTTDGRIKPDIVAPDGLPTITGIMPDTLIDPEFVGTSASTPIVAGAAALVKQLYPTWGPAEIKRALLETAIDLGEPGRDNEFGAGRLDLRRFLAEVQP